MDAKLEISGHLSSIIIKACNHRVRDRGQCLQIETVGGRKSFSCWDAGLDLDIKSPDLHLQTNLFFLPLKLHSRRQGAGGRYEGLLLQATGDAEGGFERCGLLDIWDQTASLVTVPGDQPRTASELSPNNESFDGRLRTICIM